MIQGAKDRADREIAHLTTYRIAGRPPAKVWDYDPILSVLKPVVERFLETAAPDRLDPRVPVAVAALFPHALVVPPITTVNLTTDSPQSVNATTWPGPLATGAALSDGQHTR